MRKNILILYFALLCTFALASCSTQNLFDNNLNNLFKPSPATASSGPAQPEDSGFWQGNPEAVWMRTQQISLEKLEATQNNSDPTIAGWTKLAIISKRYSTNTTELVHQIMNWRAEYPNHPGNQILPGDANLNSSGVGTAT